MQVKSLLRSKSGIVLGLLCLILMIAVLAWKDDRRSMAADAKTGQAGREAGLFYPTSSQWAALVVQTVGAEPFRAGIRTEGKIAIDEDRATRIYSPYAGRVVRLLAATGDVVQQGQQIFVIDATDSVETQKDFVSAIADFNKARSQLNLTTIVERRMANLIKDKAMSQKEWDEAKANLVSAENDLRSAEIALQAVRNRLRLLGKTSEEIDSFEKTGVISPDAPVYSPLAGTVLQRRIGPGQYVDAGASDAEPVYRIGDVAKVWLVAYVRESDASQVKLGQKIRFSVLSHPGRVFEAEISYVASSFDPETRRLLVRASIDNADGLFRPEMFASVEIVVSVYDGAPTPAVPRNAVIYEGDSARVWVARDGGAVELRQIKAGLTIGSMVQVLHGIKPGEKVITSGSLFIDRGAKIRS
jgi:cobalt-zinc-cadmium efflux system membrane fusion protein